MQTFLGIAVVVFLCCSSCGKTISDPAVKSGRSRQEALYGREFRNEDVRSIDFVQIEHPMLGGIVKQTTLTEEQQREFLAEMEKVKEKGFYKCGAKYVVRVNLASDTLRLKICSGMISNRQSDFYYVLPGKVDPVEKYWKKSEGGSSGEER